MCVCIYMFIHIYLKMLISPPTHPLSLFGLSWVEGENTLHSLEVQRLPQLTLLSVLAPLGLVLRESEHRRQVRETNLHGKETITENPSWSVRTQQ